MGVPTICCRIVRDMQEAIGDAFVKYLLNI